MEMDPFLPVVFTEHASMRLRERGLGVSEGQARVAIRDSVLYERYAEQMPLWLAGNELTPGVAAVWSRDRINVYLVAPESECLRVRTVLNGEQDRHQSFPRRELV